MIGFDKLRWFSLFITAILVFGLFVLSKTVNFPDYSGEYKTLIKTQPRLHEHSLTSTIQFSTGDVMFFPSSVTELYTMNLLYKTKKSDPFVRFVPSENASFILNLPPNAQFGAKSFLNFGLSQQVVHRIFLNTKTSKATFQLGGVPIEVLKINTGAGKLFLDFNQPNPVTLNTLTIESGASACTVKSFNNAKAVNVLLKSKAGVYSLDFSGKQFLNSTVRLQGQMSRLTLSVPKAVQMMVVLESELLSIKQGNLVRRDPLHYVTPDFDSQKPYTTVYVHVGAGQIVITN